MCAKLLIVRHRCRRCAAARPDQARDRQAFRPRPRCAPLQHSSPRTLSISTHQLFFNKISFRILIQNFVLIFFFCIFLTLSVQNYHQIIFTQNRSAPRAASSRRPVAAARLAVTRSKLLTFTRIYCLLRFFTTSFFYF